MGSESERGVGGMKSASRRALVQVIYTNHRDCMSRCYCNR
jgi:hypothetical protein